MKLTVLGLGEAGSLIAKGLAAQGVEVVGFDPVKQKNPVVEVFETAEQAVANADVVFSLNSATVSIKVAQQVTAHLKPGAIYCDLNTGTPALKQRLSEIMPAGSFVDVAVMKPVPGLAEKVPLSIAGPGAKKFLELFADLDLDITYVSAVAGEAAEGGDLDGLERDAHLGREGGRKGGREEGRKRKGFTYIEKQYVDNVPL